jgi:hypothetical protein
MITGDFGIDSKGPDSNKAGMPSYIIVSRNLSMLWGMLFSTLVLWSIFIVAAPLGLLSGTAVLFGMAPLVGLIAGQQSMFAGVFGLVSLVLVGAAFILATRIFRAPLITGDEIAIQDVQRLMIGRLLSWWITIPASMFAFLLAAAGNKLISLPFLVISIGALFLLKPSRKTS